MRFRVVHSNEFAPFSLEVRDPDFGERLERASESRSRPARALRNPALFATIARQKNDDPIGFAELIRAKNQRLGCV